MRLWVLRSGNASTFLARRLTFEPSKTAWRILRTGQIQRVNAELQIFGLVAISLFIGQNLLGTMPHDTFAFFEFVDIFVAHGISYIRLCYQTGRSDARSN